MSNKSAASTANIESMRLDKWLWAARFYKTRALAVQSISKGLVQVNDSPCKPAREIRCGDTIALRQGNMPRTVTVEGLSRQRGSATIAQALYTETEASIQLCTQLTQNRRIAPEPAHTQTKKGRPTKRDRRAIQKLTHTQANSWDSRWSAGIE